MPFGLTEFQRYGRHIRSLFLMKSAESDHINFAECLALCTNLRYLSFWASRKYPLINHLLSIHLSINQVLASHLSSPTHHLNLHRRNPTSRGASDRQPVFSYSASYPPRTNHRSESTRYHMTKRDGLRDCTRLFTPDPHRLFRRSPTVFTQ